MTHLVLWFHLVCSPVDPSLSAGVDVDEQQPLHHVGVVQL